MELTQKRATLGLQSAANPHDQQLQAKLAGLDEVIANLTGDRGRLLAQASTQGRAAVIDKSALPALPESKALAQKLGLAGLLGLVAGILFAALAETARPTVPGARRVSRRLGAPLLGALNNADLSGDATAGIDYLSLRLRLAAKHSGVSAVALASVGAGGTADDLTDLAAALERAMPWPGVVGGLDGRGGLADPVGPAENGHDGALAAEKVSAGIGRAGTLVQNHKATAEQGKLPHVYPLGRTDAAAERGRVGLVVLSGPVARVSDVAALADLVASSGWPLLGVVGVPRGRRKRSARRQPPASGSAHATSGTAPQHGGEETGR